jgi:hypothetical protein
MGKITLQGGAPTASASFLLTGFGTVAVATPGTFLWSIGWISIVFGLAVAVWGIRIGNFPWWWSKRRRLAAVARASAPRRQKTNFPLECTGHVFSDTFADGQNVEGIIWQRNFSHAVLHIANLSDENFSDIDLAIVSDAPIIEAVAKAPFCECTVGPYSLPPVQDVLLIGTTEDGERIAIPRDPTLKTIAIENKYRLLCSKLPARSEVRVDLATVKMPVIGPFPLFSEDRQAPTVIEINGSYSAGGCKVLVGSGLKFEVNDGK